MANLEGVKWSSSSSPVTVTWSFAETNFAASLMPSGYTGFDSMISAQYRSVIQSAFAAWSAVANIRFVQATDAANVNIRIGNVNIDGYPSGGGSSTLAETQYWGYGSRLTAAEIMFDVDAYSGTKLYSVAVHEIGHAIGLDHASLMSSVMYAMLNSQNQAGVLTADDISGVQSLYGAPSVVSAPSISALASLQTAFGAIMRVGVATALSQSPSLSLADGATVANALYSRALQIATLAGKVDGGTMTLAAAINTIEGFADDTTSVATVSYQFFTGRTPTAAGLDYLVASAGNAADLNDPYYAKFGMENRYINFAVNLGKSGEGASAFQSQYGALSLSQTVKGAYQQIFGTASSDSKVAAILNGSVTVNGHAGTRAEYFAAYGLDGANGIGTKAAAVGFLLAEAVKADLGPYALANDAFLTDLADGSAQYNVNLVQAYAAPMQEEVEAVGQGFTARDGFLELG